MTTGKYDRRIRVEYPKVVGKDETYKTDIIAWTKLTEFWAEIQDALPSRAEAVVEGVPLMRNPARIRYRYRRDITPSMRLIDITVFPNRTMRIISGPAEVLKAGRRNESEVYCETITP